MKKGILLIAVGHKNYLHMAINMAASIRVNDPGLKIALATDSPPPVWLKEKGVIDINVQVPDKFITHEGKTAYIKSKLFMYDLSPFDETIFLDADQIMIKDRRLSPVFQEMETIDVSFSNTGVSKDSFWVDNAEVRELYGDKPFWDFHSEFVYFRKGKPAKDFFKAALRVFTSAKFLTAKPFGSAPMADELAFQCAAIITGIYPHKEVWLPNFWSGRDLPNSRKYPYELKQYITYSIGGVVLPRSVKDNYNTLAKHYFATLGLSNPFQAEDKRDYLPERKHV